MITWAATARLLQRYGPMIALVLFAAGGAWWLRNDGWHAGYAARDAELAAETAARQARLDDLAADLRATKAALARANRDRADLERTLINEASDDPMADDPGLGLDSLRRLDRIR